jgi:uncharacterized protein YcaQ
MALAAQGFATPRPSGRIDRRHLRKVMDHIGLIQIDSVNVLVRSQELPLFSRLGNHPRSLIPDATNDGELFEYWCHEASHLPVSMHPLMRWRMEQAKQGEMWGGLVRAAKQNPALLKEIRQRVYQDGPLVAGDVKTRKGPKGSWWDWDTGKALLEYLFWSGEITARRRSSDFARMYYAPQHAIPDNILNMPTPHEVDARRELVLLAAKSVGVGTLSDLADYHRQTPTKIRDIVRELVADGELESVRVEGWRDMAYKLPHAKMPRTVMSRALLSPFDSLVWCRPRLERLFNFHYRIEIYTPAAKRIYGYYVLPFLLGDEIVARVDVKADRKEGTLLVLGAFGEPDIDIAYVARELKEELRLMADWLGLEDVRVTPNGDVATVLAKRGLAK